MKGLQWDGVTACNIARNDLEILKNFMQQYSGAGVFFLVDDIPPGRPLVQVRPFSSVYFCARIHSLNMFSFFRMP